MAKVNPFRFSTKYQDNETDLLYYGYRYYNASTGRWLSRDPSSTRDSNEYLFVKNNSLSGYDVLGLWYADVHKDMTTRWAGEVGIDYVQSQNIGAADIGIDEQYSVYDVNDWNWSWHFNRSLTGDSRLKHRDIELMKAKLECSVGDNPYNAAAYLGRALHPLQDIVAHGDYNRKAELPNPSLLQSGLMLWHNFAAGGFFEATYPDAASLDANGPHGQPTADVMHWVPEGGGKVGWTEFHGGRQRLDYTEQISKQLMRDFQQFVRGNARACGECRKAFLGGQ